MSLSKIDVLPELHTVTVADEHRDIRVCLEDRTRKVAAEVRTVEVGPELRAVNVAPHHNGVTILAPTIGFDSAETAYVASGAATWSHTCTAAPNTVLYVAICDNFGDGSMVTSVSYAGSALLRVFTENSTESTSLYLAQFPPSGTHDVVVTSTTEIFAVSISYSGIDQEDPFTTESSGTTSSGDFQFFGSIGPWKAGIITGGVITVTSGGVIRATLPTNIGVWVDANGVDTPIMLNGEVTGEDFGQLTVVALDMKANS